MTYKYERVLVSGDTHFPYHRKSYFTDLKNIIREYKPDLFVHVGDLVDLHAISKHQPEPEAHSSQEEYLKARFAVSTLKTVLGPIETRLCMGNHDARIEKQCKLVNVVPSMIKSFKDVYNIPDNWLLANEHVIDNIVYLHGKSAVRGKVALNYGMSCVQGHFHHLLSVDYLVSAYQRIFSCYTGAACDDKTIAFTYAKENITKSAYGFIVITKGQPNIIIP